MSNFPNVNPKIYTLAATLIGYALLEENWSANEQNAVANWLLLIGQIIETNSAFKQITGNDQNTNVSNNNYSNDIDNLKRAIQIMQEEIEKINKDL